MSDIDEFEKRFPVPDGVFWSEDFQQYEAESMEFEPDADGYHEKWQVWQAAREQGGESQAPAPIVEALGVLVSNNLRPDVQGKLKALINGWREQQGGEAVGVISQIVEELENGFVACRRCGDQEDTANLDCMGDLKRLRSLLAHPQPAKVPDGWSLHAKINAPAPDNKGQRIIGYRVTIPEGGWSGALDWLPNLKRPNPPEGAEL